MKDKGGRLMGGGNWVKVCHHYVANQVVLEEQNGNNRSRYVVVVEAMYGHCLITTLAGSNHREGP